MDLIVLILWLTTMFMALLSIYQVIRSLASGEWLKLRHTYQRLQRHKFHSKMTRLSYTSPGLSGLWHQLLIRVNFDIDTAERLIQDLRRKYPNKEDRWYIQKAIWNIEAERSRSSNR